MNMGTSCAFTGHRPHKFPWRYDETSPDCVALKAVLCEQVTKLMQAGITDYYSGMADGSDVWLSQVVLALREKNPALKLHCVLPCEEQADKWSDLAQKRYYSILAQADEISYVSRKYYNGCMLARKRRLVDSTDLVLAVYNGERRGGTAATIRYAKRNGRKTLIIDPITRNIECFEMG